MDGLQPRPGDTGHPAQEGYLEPLTTDSEPGMNVISADFDIVMVNRANERLYGKAMVDLLGKKCYREFEKRDAPCAHCPGIPAQATGQSHEAETIGIRDDGSRFAARVRAVPVQGPGDQPAGFIEVVEDITERKRSERIAQIDTQLRTSLASASDTWKALQRTLEAALMLEGIDSGCVFLVDPSTRQPTLVAEKGLPPEYVRALDDAQVLAEVVLPAADLAARFAEIPGAPKAAVSVPILHKERALAVLVLGSSDYPGIPASMIDALDNLAKLVGNAVARIRAEQSRGDAVADLEAFVAAAPLAVWSLDSEGKVRMWNRAAERLFGWRASEVLNHPPLFIPEGLEKDYRRLHKAVRSSGGPEGLELRAVTKTGDLISIRAFGAPFRDVVGDASRVIAMAQDATDLLGRVRSRDGAAGAGPAGADLEVAGTFIGADSLAEATQDFSGLLAEIAGSVKRTGKEDNEGVFALADSIVNKRGGSLGVDSVTDHSMVMRIVLPRRVAAPAKAPAATDASAPNKVLVVDSDGKSCTDLRRILRRLGRPFVVCASGLEAVEQFRAAFESAKRFDLVILELMMRTGPSGLETAAQLRALDPTVKAIVSSDSAVLGYEPHGFAAALRKPYTAAGVAEALAKL